MEFIPVKRYWFLRELAFEYDINDRTMLNYVHDFIIPHVTEGPRDAIALKQNGKDRLKKCYTLLHTTGMHRKVIGRLSNDLIDRILKELDFTEI